MICLSINSFVFAADPPQWEMTGSIQYEGIDISLSKPRLVARSSGYLWFPTMTRLSDGELFANFSTNRDEVVADRTSSVSWSDDHGLTWSTPVSIDPKGDLYAETMLRLKNGNALLLPFNLYPDNGRMRGWYQKVAGTRRERKVEFFDKSLTVSGWPRPDRSFNEKLGLCGFGFNGQCVPAKTGEYLATMYGYFQGDQRYSLVLVESTDGIDWKFRSRIAGADCRAANDLLGHRDQPFGEQTRVEPVHDRCNPPIMKIEINPGSHMRPVVHRHRNVFLRMMDLNSKGVDELVLPAERSLIISFLS
jgi:hypothetical protein